MACSKFEYVKQFESQEKLLPSTYIVVRLDGKGFTKFCNAYGFEKPNDIRGIQLMNKAASTVVQNFPDIWFAYGQSDEYSFVLRKNTTLYNRRSEKISTTLASCFSSAYTMFFKDFFPDKELKDIPMFDGRCVCYPSDEILRDYLSWRQADCHINNLYNTCFWSLVQKGGCTEEEAHKFLKGTDSAAKNELLFNRFGINYAKIEPIYRKGTIIIRLPQEKEEVDKVVNAEQVIEEVKEDQTDTQKTEKEDSKGKKDDGEKEVEKKKENKSNPKVPKEPRKKYVVTLLHEDIIGNSFWEKYKESVLL